MATEPIYLVTDAGSPVTAFTTKDEMKAYLKRSRGTLDRLLVYRIDGEGHPPVIMTLARAMGRRAISCLNRERVAVHLIERTPQSRRRVLCECQ